MIAGKRLHFTKMHGIGNDYVYMDGLGGPGSISPDKINLSDLSIKVSNRHLGIGSDGLIVILPSEVADFRMRMFNADGSEAQMCGNGIRCVALYLYEKDFTNKTEFSIETLGGTKHVILNKKADNTLVTVGMGKAILKPSQIPVISDQDDKVIDMPVTVDDQTFMITPVSMGNPHGVITVENINDKHIHHYGKLLEVHPIWPEKANIEFVEVLNRHTIRMRVWERGSGETLACGTGACASVVATCLKGLTDNEVEVKLLGGFLYINYDKENGNVTMTGEAEFISEGDYFYK